MTMHVRPTESEVAAFLAGCPENVPATFVEFHRRHGAVNVEVDLMESRFVFLWPLCDVVQNSFEYGFDEFAPGLFGIGSNGGGELYAIDVRNETNDAVGEVPATALLLEDFRILANSFSEFAEKLLTGTPA